MNARLQRFQRQLVRLLGVEREEQRAGKLEHSRKHRSFQISNGKFYRRV